MNIVHYICSDKYLYMTRKQIQEQRMKDYFIQATKEIIKGEGLKAVSVRSIGEKAGYSFATIYNYFKDVKELIFFCVRDFQLECQAYIEEKTKEVEKGEEKIKAIIKSYADYFIEYPSVFELFFVEKLPPSNNNLKISELLASFLDKLCLEEFEYCININQYKVKETEEMMKELNAVSLGMLVFYINRHSPSSHSDFDTNLNLQVNRIMKRNN